MYQTATTFRVPPGRRLTMSQEQQDRPSDETGADEVYMMSDREQVS